MKNDSPYNGSGSLTREQFLFYEMRMTAKLICENLDDEQVIARIVSENLFQFPTEKSVRRIAQGCISRLKALDDTSLVQAIATQPSYGSILNITPVDFDAIYARFDALYDEISMYSQPILNDLLPFIRVAQMLAQKYEVVVTNPPYMGSSGMGAKLGEYVKKNYPDSKSDLFAVFIERCGQMTAHNCYQAMITQHAWMFLSSFEKLRAKLLQIDTVNMVHLGARAFDEIGGEVVQTTSFVMRKSHVQCCKGVYCRLIEPTTQNGKEMMFLSGENRYESAQDNFSKIPGSPIAYWVSRNIYSIFALDCLNKHYDIKAGMCTGENAIYILRWQEVDYSKTFMSSRKNYTYTAHNKGGEYRKWYGNRELVLKYSPSSLKAMESNEGFRHDGKGYYFREHIGWSKITSGCTSFRLFEEGFTFDSAGLGLFPTTKQSTYLTLAFLNSKVSEKLILLLNPTLNVTPMVVKKLPFTDLEKASIVEPFSIDCVLLCRDDWDAFETSWDFKRHPLIECRIKNEELRIGNEELAGRENNSTLIKIAYENWEKECNDRFNQLKANEEKLNRIFIDIYGLQDELTPEVEDKDVTVRLADKKRDIRSLISYAVGCMFGRYSLDVDGLAYAGGEWDDSKYSTFIPDRDNIIPICDDEYFDDDITGRFVKFIETVYGKETLDENLRFIADALGGSGQPKDVIRNYFLNDFYADHLKIYQKRPIYWLFDSGKKNGFKALIYMHRYAPDTLARMRTDYVHEQQARYRTAIADVEHRIDAASASERVKLTKQHARLSDQSDEIRAYEEIIHHLADQMIRIDLDDGVKHNYAIFEDVLAKIK